MESRSTNWGRHPLASTSASTRSLQILRGLTTGQKDWAACEMPGSICCRRSSNRASSRCARVGTYEVKMPFWSKV
eukprot:1824733-Rhodomonas_salina.1